MKGEGKKRILILWTSAEKDTALNMVFRYGLNTKLKGGVGRGAHPRRSCLEGTRKSMGSGRPCRRRGWKRSPARPARTIRPGRKAKVAWRPGSFHRGTRQPRGLPALHAACLAARQTGAMELTFPFGDSPRHPGQFRGIHVRRRFRVHLLTGGEGGHFRALASFPVLKPTARSGTALMKPLVLTCPFTSTGASPLRAAPLSAAADALTGRGPRDSALVLISA